MPRTVSLQSEFAFFFFQAEDGIRDLTVTGVQTCALPILEAVEVLRCSLEDYRAKFGAPEERARKLREMLGEIGRASCRGRGEISVGAVSLKKKKGAGAEGLGGWARSRSSGSNVQ